MVPTGILHQRKFLFSSYCWKRTFFSSSHGFCIGHHCLCRASRHVSCLDHTLAGTSSKSPKIKPFCTVVDAVAVIHVGLLLNKVIVDLFQSVPDGESIFLISFLPPKMKKHLTFFPEEWWSVVVFSSASWHANLRSLISLRNFQTSLISSLLAMSRAIATRVQSQCWAQFTADITLAFNASIASSPIQSSSHLSTFSKHWIEVLKLLNLSNAMIRCWFCEQFHLSTFWQLELLPKLSCCSEDFELKLTAFKCRWG